MDFKALEYKPQRMEHYFKASHRVQTQGKREELFCILFSDDGLECFYEQPSNIYFPATTSCLTVLLMKERVEFVTNNAPFKGQSSKLGCF